MSTTLIIGVLVALLLATVFFTYLLYVRLRQIQNEVEELRSTVEVTDDEIDRLGSTLDSMDVEL
ncbi:MAG: hypothetical protein SV760_04505 [Halobacteria archaeon]|nr:hypothetical protein [Halobacteria archaeon]